MTRITVEEDQGYGRYIVSSLIITAVIFMGGVGFGHFMLQISPQYEDTAALVCIGLTTMLGLNALWRLLGFVLKGWGLFPSFLVLSLIGLALSCAAVMLAADVYGAGFGAFIAKLFGFISLLGAFASGFEVCRRSKFSFW